MHFKDQVVWITGASSGIGAELARQLGPAGARLILTGRNTDALEEVAASCGGTAALLPANLTDRDALAALPGKAIAAFGHIDLIIHSAGVSQRSLAEETGEAVYRHLMEINFFAPLALTQALLPHFRRRAKGHIVVISSVAGLVGVPLRTGYAAAKHAVKGWFESLQTEHTIPGLHITVVYPGRIHTPISLSALRADGTRHNKMDKGQLHGISVSVCAAKIIRAIKRRKRRVLIARGERILWWLWFCVPSIYYRVARNSSG